MSRQNIKGKRRYRWLAGLFCVSLFLSEVMSVGVVASAQESVPAVEGITLQENDGEKQELDGSAEQTSGSGEGGDATEPESGDEESEDGQESGDEESEDGQEPGDEESEDEQEPGDEENVDEQEPGDEESVDEQEPDDGNDAEVEEIPDSGEGELSVSENTVSENAVSENALEEGGSRLLAAGDDIAGGSYEKVTWVIRADGELIVEGEGEFAPSAPATEESTGRAPWYAYREKITSATIRLTGTKDLSDMFKDCQNIESVDLSCLETDMAMNMSRMFYNCDCWRLLKLDVSGFDTSNVTDMSDMFYNCIGPMELDVSSFDTRNVTDMSGMFRNCINLTQLDVSGFDTSSVTDMSEMFLECNNLPKLDVSGFDTSSVTDMSGMFNGCIGTGNWIGHIDLDVSGFNTRNVTDMSHMFDRCYATDLDVSSFDTSNVTDMSGMFRNCGGLTQLDVSGFDTSNVTDMNNMFAGCENLTQLNVSGFDTRNVTDMTSMFSSCENLKELDLSDFATWNVASMALMFSSCKSLTELDLKHFSTSNVIYMAGMFYTCENLVELDLSSFDTSKVTSMGQSIWDAMVGMFTGCKKLERLDVSSFDTGNVKTMDAMFDGCESLKELDLSSFCMNLSMYTSGQPCCMFFLRNCNSLEKLYTPYWRNAAVPLPKEKDSDVWRGVIDGEEQELTEMPKGVSGSVLLVKNKTQVQVEERIMAKKVRTLYDCGEALSLDDLSVTLYEAEGSIRTLQTTEYTTNAAKIDMSTPGEKTLTVTYDGGGTALTAEIKLKVVYKLTAENTTVSLENFEYVYTGQPVKPVPTVVFRISGTEVTLEAGTDYTLSYRNNVKAEAGALVIITGAGNYDGKFLYSFQIRKAAAPAAEQILCHVSDCDSAVADRKLELSRSFAGCGSKTGYHIVSVTEDDVIAGAVLARTPVDTDISSGGTFTYSTNAGKSGDFVTVKLRVSFDNYKTADLTVKIVFFEEKVGYTITYDTMGHGGSGFTERVKAGSLIREPKPLAESGYLFTGWYADRHLARKWDFAADTVQEDITLYAGWLSDRSEGKLQMYIQDIEDMVYIGKALKPQVVVYDSDGETLLKAGKDYTVKYYNNVNAGGAETAGAVAKAVNPGKKEETLTNIVPGRGAEDESTSSHDFTKDAPYIAITGKGNYTETVYKNFCIRPAGIGTQDNTPAQGITMKYTDQLVIDGKKEQKPFSSMKYKKAMKAGVDYKVSLGVIDVFDAKGQAVSADWKVESGQENRQNPAIPKGYSGTFLLTIVGQGNYTGEIRRTVFVNSKDKLIKNTSIILGRDQKSRPYTGRAVTLTDFVVKAGTTILAKGQDYTVSYTDNVAVGTATMTITGKNRYVGSKSVTFKITGEKFTTGNIIVKEYDKEYPSDNDFKASMPYTGSAVLQNKVTLATKATKEKPNSKQLVYGTHYTISYKNNVKKGTATMIFTAKPESGYSGSFKKTFRITAQPLAWENLTVHKTEDNAEVQAVYRKNGARPSFVLTDAAGVVLTQGKDYTVKCKNNMAVTTAQTPEDRKPVMTITGKGSYTGKLEVPFQVVQESLETAVESGTVQISCTKVMKKAEMQFKDFKFKLTEGKKTLVAGQTKDYTLDLADCTPEKLLAYAEALETGTASGQTEPSVTIKGTGVNYTGTVTVPLGGYLYAEKLDNRNLYVVVSEGKGQNIYTGKQLTPTVAVYHGDARAVRDAKNAKEKDDEMLTAANGSYRLMKLTENVDYTLAYGVNKATGKNKGSVKVIGAGKYGGSVTVKFTIEKKSICTTASFPPVSAYNGDKQLVFCMQLSGRKGTVWQYNDAWQLI